MSDEGGIVYRGLKKSVEYFERWQYPPKQDKRSNKHDSGNAYILRYVHLSIVADDVWLWVRLRDRQGKHRGNKYCMGTVVAEGQRDALPWTDVMLSTSYNKYHEWTSCWTSPMNKCEATSWWKYAFPDPCVVVFFFMLWYVLPPITILGTFAFSLYEQVCRSQKACISGPIFIGVFFLVLVGTTTSQNFRHF